MLSIGTGKDDEVINVEADGEKHLLQITMGGFKTFAQEFTVSEGTPQSIRVYLEPDPSVSLGEAGSSSQTMRSASGNPSSRSPSANIASLRFDRSTIDPYELRVAGRGDPANAPAELVAVLGNSRFTQTTAMDSIACGPDGLAATTTNDGVLIWNMETGEMTRQFRVPNEDFRSGNLDWHSGSNVIAALGNIGQIMVADVNSEEVQVISSEPKVGGTIAFSHDGQMIATGHSDGMVQIRSRLNAESSRRLVQLDSPIKHVAFSPDNEWLAVVSAQRIDGENVAATIYSVTDGTVISHLRHKSYLQDEVAFAPDGKTIAICDYNGVYLWDAKSGEQIAKLEDGSRRVGGSSLRFAPDGNWLALLSVVGIEIWNTAEGVLVGRTEGKKQGISSRMDISDDGEWLVTVSSQKREFASFRTREISGVVEEPFDRALGGMRAMDLSADGRKLAWVGMTHGMEVWDVETGSRDRLLGDEDDREVRGLALNHIGDRLAALANNSGLSVWDTTSGQRINSRPDLLNFPRQVEFLKGTNQLVTAGLNEPTQYWDVETLEELPSTVDVIEGSYGISIGPEAKRYVRSTLDGAQLREISSAKLIRTFEGMHGFVALNPTLPLLAMQYSANALTIHDTSDTEPPRIISNLGYLYDVAWSHDGTLLAIGDQQNVVLWDNETSREVTRWPMPGEFKAVEFSPDDRYLFAGNSNSVVYVLDLDQIPKDE